MDISFNPNRSSVDEPRDVFILGAGFSKAISGQMPLLRELSTAVASRVIQPNVVATTSYLMDDIELAMTFLAQPQPWMSEAQQLRNRAAFLELTEAIATEINERSAGVRSLPIPDWLLRFVHWLHFRKAIVITLNYDTLLEDATTRIPGGDCYPKHLVPFRFAADESSMAGGDVCADSLQLLKLHGSVNWRYSGRTAYAGELIQWSGVSGWTDQALSTVRKEKIADTVPLIVPPTADKTGYFLHHSIQYLWKRARQALTSARRVFCIGYSLPATDLTIRFLFSDLPRKHVLDFYLVNRPGTMEHYREVLPDALFRLSDRFIGEDPVEPFVDNLFTDEFFPDYASASSQPPGPVEKAIRDRVGVGVTFPAALKAGTCVVDSFTRSSITLLLDREKIPVRLPWNSLEDLAGELRQSLSVQEFDKTLRSYCDRNLGPWIAALLAKAGVATVWWKVNRWVVSPIGTDEEEIARSKLCPHA